MQINIQHLPPSQLNPHCQGGITASTLQTKKLRRLEAKPSSKFTWPFRGRGGAGIQVSERLSPRLC